MKRAVLLATALALGAGAGSASAASPHAGCVGLITSAEAQSAPGAVGTEVSGLATSLPPGSLGAFVSGLAKQHAGSIQACAGGND